MDKKQFNERGKNKSFKNSANDVRPCQEAKQRVGSKVEELHDDDGQEVIVGEVEDADDDDLNAQVQCLEQQVMDLNAALEEEKKKYMYLYAEFDNFRKRTIKEKAELIRSGGEAAFKGLLPIIDDFERGIEAVKKSGGDTEGLELIYNKLIKYLEQNGVKAFDESEDMFDADRHEAITAIDGPEENKGKIIDTVQKGYTIHGDKVLRHAKVVVSK